MKTAIDGVEAANNRVGRFVAETVSTVVHYHSIGIKSKARESLSTLLQACSVAPDAFLDAKGAARVLQGYWDSIQGQDALIAK